MIKVAKFGGSSVADASQFRKVRDIVLSDPSRRLVVVSAAGKRDSKDHKITDLLYLCHAHLTYGVSCDEIFDKIRARFIEIRDDLNLTFRIEDELDALHARLNKEMSIDELVSRGEYLTSRLMAEFLGYTFLDARDCIFMDFDGKFQPEKITQAIKEAVSKYQGIVIPGFYGSLPSGKIKVMSRGGSDITGSLVAAACNADLYENWTDVSGILMADPRIVDNPRAISEITFAELRELNDPSHPGTMIVDSASSVEPDQDKFITGIAGKRNFIILTVTKRLNNSNEALRDVLEILDRHKVQAEHISMGIDQFALVLSQASIGDGLYEIIGDIRTKCSPEDVEVQDGIALIAAVGRKMIFRPGISGKVFNALGKEGINIRTIAQGSDELAIIVGVDNSQFENTVRVLYHSFAG